MTSCSLNEISDEYAFVEVMLNARQRVIRCRGNRQWIFQRRNSADLNKGHWVHTSWESLTARYSGIKEALNANIHPNAVVEDNVVWDDYDGQG